MIVINLDKRSNLYFSLEQEPVNFVKVTLRFNLFAFIQVLVFLGKDKILIIVFLVQWLMNPIYQRVW